MRNKAITRILLVIPLALLAGCDPGMTICQINPTADSKKAAVIAARGIAIEVKTTHQLIGESWYDPQVKVTNSSDSPIAIASIELVAQGVSYENKRSEAQTYPITLPARGTASLEIGFRFNEGVCKMFKQPAELRIHYLTHGDVGLARTTVAGGPLDAG